VTTDSNDSDRTDGKREHSEHAVEINNQGLYELAKEKVTDGTNSLLDEHFGALGEWIAATLVKLDDLRLEFRPTK
jgi:hypothetical protein